MKTRPKPTRIEKKGLGKFDRLAVDLAAYFKKLPARELEKFGLPLISTPSHELANMPTTLHSALDRPRVYMWLLQSFLASMSIRWPEAVFVTDYSTPGTGRRSLPLDDERVAELRRDGLPWSDVAGKVLPDRPRTTRSAKLAADKVRKRAARAGSKTVRGLQLLASSKLEDRKTLHEWLEVLRHRERVERIRKRLNLPADKQYDSVSGAIIDAMLRESPVESEPDGKGGLATPPASKRGT